MAEIYIVYASQSGRTRKIIQQLKESLALFLHNIKTIDAMHAEIDAVLKADLIILASYTWDESEGYLPPEMVDFMTDLVTTNIRDNTFAVIGTGDHFYPGFAFSTSEMLSYLIPHGAHLISPQLKIDIPDKVEELADYQLLLKNITQFLQAK